MFTRFAATFLLIHHFQPFTSNFPHGNIYKMISPDILHQLIKGAFKDHLVAWVGLNLLKEHGECKAGVILDDIDWWQVIS
jgi:Plavaka transposase